MILGPAGARSTEVIRADELTNARSLTGLGVRPPSVDDSGRWYFEGARQVGYLGDRSLFDSIAVERRLSPIDVVADTVVSFPRPPDSGAIPSYRPAHDYAVCSDGTIFVASPDPYRVSSVGPSGQSSVGSVLEYSPVGVTDAVVERWQALQEQSYSIGMVMSRNGGDRQLVINPSQADNMDKWEWPDVLPPFGRDAVRCGPGNQLWVERITEPGSPPLIDVFGPGGNRVRQFELPDGARIVGFSANSVYTVVTDEFALQYLMRIPVPN